jgi:dihydroorotase
VTDHAPHVNSEKELGFQNAPPGIIGLETALPLFIKALIETEVLEWPRMIAALSTRPAELLRVPGGTLKVGSRADVTLIDPEAEWTIDVEQMCSKSRNTPFDGWAVRGRATTTVIGGEIRHRLETVG